jgi:hypothetical protein
MTDRLDEHRSHDVDTMYMLQDSHSLAATTSSQGPHDALSSPALRSSMFWQFGPKAPEAFHWAKASVGNGPCNQLISTIEVKFDSPKTSLSTGR